MKVHKTHSHCTILTTAILCIDACFSGMPQPHTELTSMYIWTQGSCFIRGSWHPIHMVSLVNAIFTLDLIIKAALPAQKWVSRSLNYWCEYESSARFAFYIVAMYTVIHSDSQLMLWWNCLSRTGCPDAGWSPVWGRCRRCYAMHHNEMWTRVNKQMQKSCRHLA